MIFIEHNVKRPAVNTHAIQRFDQQVSLMWLWHKQVCFLHLQTKNKIKGFFEVAGFRTFVPSTGPNPESHSSLKNTKHCAQFFRKTGEHLWATSCPGLSLYQLITDYARRLKCVQTCNKSKTSEQLQQINPMTVCVQNTYVKTKSYAGKLAMLRHLKTFLNHIRPSAPPECKHEHEKNWQGRKNHGETSCTLPQTLLGLVDCFVKMAAGSLLKEMITDHLPFDALLLL